MKKTLQITILLLIFFSFSCNKDDETSNDPYFAISKFLVEEKVPNKVNILFQVFDEKGKGVTDLNTDDFTVLEDNKAISLSESEMTIIKNGEIDYEINTVLLIDNSKSIGDNLNIIKNSAKKLIDRIKTNQNIAIYSFSENAILLQDFTNDINELYSAIDKIELGASSTNLHGALVTGLERLEVFYSLEIIKESALIVFTDGEDTQASTSLEEVIEKRQNKKIYALGLGSEINETTLKEIANAAYYYAEDINQLEDLFSNIQDEILKYINSFYCLYYQSPKRGNSEHTIELKINANSNNSETNKIKDIFNSKYFFSSSLYDYKFAYLRNDLNLTSSKKGLLILKKDKTKEECELLHIGILNKNFDYDIIFVNEAPTQLPVEPNNYYTNGNFNENVIGIQSIIENYNEQETMVELNISKEVLNKKAVILFKNINGSRIYDSSGILFSD